MHKSHNKLAASAAGYPATLFGFTPDERGYWIEPGLPWANGPNIHLAIQLTPLEFLTTVMAPRFPYGAIVMAKEVSVGEPLPAGVYAFKAPHEIGFTLCVGRLLEPASPAANALLLQRDNSPAGVICLLEWTAPGFQLFRVTHYASLPAE